MAREAAFGPAELDEARRLAEDYRREKNLDSALAPYLPFAWFSELDPLTKLHLDDLSGIPFLTRVLGVGAYQHRARVRAENGDCFAAVADPAPGYEAYCRDRLGLGDVELIRGDGRNNPLAVSDACTRGACLDRLVARARAQGVFALHPYMGIHAAWSLAETISRAAGTPAHVLAPPPPVTWIANDKKDISEITRRIAGEEHIVETHYRASPEGLVDALLDLAERHSAVALKRTRCASAMGNRVFESRSLSARSKSDLILEIERFLEETEWKGDEEVLAVAWEAALHSPSTQLWLPPAVDGPPVVEGVYEQLLLETEKIFLGSRPSTLGAAVEHRLTQVSLRVAAVLQALGYVGRCSFDFLVVPEESGFEVRLTECNGRWGGTSTPMSLVDRIWREDERPMYRAQDFVSKELVGVSFSELVDRLGSELFDAGTQEGRFVVYNVGCLQPFGKFDVIIFGDSVAEVDHYADVELPKILGVTPTH